MTFSRLKQLVRWIDRQQQRLIFRIVGTVLAVVLCGAFFGPLSYAAHDFESTRNAVYSAVWTADLTANDEHALSLRDETAIHLGDRTFKLPEQFQGQGERLFDPRSGRIWRPEQITMALVAGEIPAWAPRWLIEIPDTTTTLGFIGLAWLLAVVWLGVTAQFLVATIVAAGAAYIANLFGAREVALAFGAIGLLLFSYVLLMRVFLFAYSRPNQMLAVAATVLREATRTKVPLVFVVLLLVALPMIPLTLDPEQPLRFRMQSFISASMGWTFFLAACMTVVLACATVAFEIRDRQIWQLVSKPVSKLSYLAGKWLGIVTVNIVIMSIAAISIFTFIQYFRQQTQDASRDDTGMMQSTVLTARIGRWPDYEPMTPDQVNARVEELIKKDADLSLLDEIPISERRRLAVQVAGEFSRGQRSILPRRDREFLFTGLETARQSNTMLTLRYRFHILRDDEHETFPALFVFNEEFQQRVNYIPTITQVIPVQPHWINEDGTLKLTIVNLLDERTTKFTGSGALNWEIEDFELLYEVSSFESNFLRAVLVDLVKLSFLAMLGICMATFLNFPVACLASFTIFLAGFAAPYLSLSMRDWLPPDASTMDWANIGLVIKWLFISVLRWVATTVLWLFGAFGSFRTTPMLVEGRLVSWSTVFGATGMIGVLWSSIALIVGFLVLRSRQLAIYSGHG